MSNDMNTVDPEILEYENSLSGLGRPLKYATVADLQAVIDYYFYTTKQDEWTVTGLALAIGGKQLLDDYQKRPGYREAVWKAKLMVENSYEIALRKNGRAGEIFALKNFGWSDKQEVEHSGGTKIIIEHTRDELPPEA